MHRCYGASSVQSISWSRGIVQVWPPRHRVIAQAQVTAPAQPEGGATQLQAGTDVQHPLVFST
jgi:hypothetical protein